MKYITAPENVKKYVKEGKREGQTYEMMPTCKENLPMADSVLSLGACQNPVAELTQPKMMDVTTQ